MSVPDDQIRKLGSDTIEAVLAFADGKLDRSDLQALGALISDLQGLGLDEMLGKLVVRQIGVIDGLDVAIVD